MRRAVVSVPLSSAHGRVSIAIFGVFAATLLGAQPARSQDAAGIVGRGDVVVTGFSGTVTPDPAQPLPASTTLVDETFIDLDGASAKIFDVSAPGYVWYGSLWDEPALREFTAGEIGQVFGTAIDDLAPANIYFTATSAFGLQIVVPDQDNDGRPERIKTGQPGAYWMPGQFGADPAAGPGTIYKVDGATGDVSVFANIELNREPNTGAGLGNIAYDAISRQLFVSDLDTGMIHRLDLAGNDLEQFDHGVEGRAAALLPEVPFDPSNRLDITRSDFDSEDPDSRALAAPERRVWGLAAHDGRVYYAVGADMPQIWSVGIAEDGSFAGDPRWELDVWKDGPGLEVSDMVFSNLGAMILAQRGERTASYDYSKFIKPRHAQVYRYWLEDPDDPATESAWILEPEEYAVRFPVDYRNTDGGVDLGFGYNELGQMNFNVCEVSLWTTGENLRRNQELQSELLPGGPETVHGVQGAPAQPVRDFNTPPWASYMLDYDGRHDDPEATGHMGDVEILGCRGADRVETVYYYGGPGYEWETPPYTVVEDGGGCPNAPYCNTTCLTPPCVLPPPPPEPCMQVTDLKCDPGSSPWTYTFSLFDTFGIGVDTVKIIPLTPGISASPGVVGLSGGQGTVGIGGASPGQTVQVQLCGFNQASAGSGKPFDCCRQTVNIACPIR